jgi:SAM-dependent methyltransferase
MAHTHKDTCRICASTDLLKVLSLGEHPPVDNFISPDKLDDEQRYPLEVYFCRSCNLVQLVDVVPPTELFHDSYAFYSSASAPLVRHFEAYATQVKERYLTPGDLVVDIGSNDGALLQFFLPEHRVLGIEPSSNVAEAARNNGIETIVEFFNEELAQRIVQQYGKAKVVTANNVFAHIDDIDEIVRGVKALLTDDGVFVSESHYLLDLMQHMEFDTVYHEHLCYYSVKPLQRLFERFDMEVFDVERVAQHGGSIRVFARKRSSQPISPRVRELLDLEEKHGLHTEETFLGLQERVNGIRDTLVSLIRKLRQEGRTVVGYGAPAKSGTLLNFCGLTASDLAHITDTTAHKVGRLTPGSHIPVVSPDVLKTHTPDYILLLAWNYRDFILEKEKDLRARGVKFIIPIPTVEVV